MRLGMQISETGLKLIKAYEGFRPVDRHLVNGQHVVGYGHIIEPGESLVLSKPEAETLLLDDLKPYEDMINNMVHAPLTQSQYDALVSLAFNIGPRAFIESDTIRALNNGRPLDAANSFDVWRKATVNGKTYVVDALIRRRAAEKALFLRTEGKKTLRASRADLPPVKDEVVAMLKTEDALPVISNMPRNGFVKRVPYAEGEIVDEDAADVGSYAALNAPQPSLTQINDDEAINSDGIFDEQADLRRREDGPSGILELCEVYDGDDEGGPEVEDAVEAQIDAQMDTEIDDIAVAEIEDIDADDLPVEIGEFDDLVDHSYEVDDSQPVSRGAESSSLIADTASKLSKRLDALIDNVKGENRLRAENKTQDVSSTLLPQTDIPEIDISETDIAEMEISDVDMPDMAASDMASPEIDTPEMDTQDNSDLDIETALFEPEDIPDPEPADIVIDNLVEDDAFRARTDSAAKYIEIEPAELDAPKPARQGYLIPLLIGFSLMGASAGAFFGNTTELLGEWGPLLSFTGIVIGFLLSIFTVYYALKAK